MDSKNGVLIETTIAKEIHKKVVDTEFEDFSNYRVFNFARSPWGADYRIGGMPETWKIADVEIWDDMDCICVYWTKA